MAPCYRLHQLSVRSLHPHDHWPCPHRRIQTEILPAPPHQLPLKLKFKPENTLSWNVIDMIPPRVLAISSLIALSTFLQITLKHLALTMNKVPSRCGSLEQKHSIRHLVFTNSYPLPQFSGGFLLLSFLSTLFLFK